jgi:hypothetical protein
MVLASVTSAPQLVQVADVSWLPWDDETYSPASDAMLDPFDGIFAINDGFPGGY